VLRELLAAIENGGYVPKQKETVARFMERWLDTYAATNTTLRTQQGYQGNVNRYIAPAIGNIDLQKLTARHIQGMYADLLAQGLSARTVLHTHRVLSEALSHGVRWGLLTRNVAEAATPPHPQHKAMEMWDADTINRFLEAARISRFHDLYHLAILTGMRRSELCGLQWPAVDLLAGKLSVSRTLQRILGKGLVEGQPKTGKSRRSIALSPEAVNLLHAVRGRQIEQRLAAGEAWHNTGYVFTQADGTPVEPDKVTQEFARVVKVARLPHLTLHGLRHAHATLLLTAGVHLKVVSERLGHSNIAITADTYSHVLPGLQEAAALALDQRLARGH
jgi:integrase